MSREITVGGDGGNVRRLFRQISTHWSFLKGPHPTALDYLARTYGPAIQNYISGRLSAGSFRPLDRWDADDVFQDLFLRMGRNGWLKKPDPARGHFRRFLVGQIEFFLSERRKSALAKLGREVVGSLDDVPDPAGPDPVRTRFEKEWKRASIEETLRRIRRGHPARCAALVAYIENPGRTAAEIARKLGRSVESYRSLLREARREFRRLYPVIEARLDGRSVESS